MTKLELFAEKRTQLVLRQEKIKATAEKLKLEAEQIHTNLVEMAKRERAAASCIHTLRAIISEDFEMDMICQELKKKTFEPSDDGLGNLGEKIGAEYIDSGAAPPLVNIGTPETYEKPEFTPQENNIEMAEVAEGDISTSSETPEMIQTSNHTAQVQTAAPVVLPPR